MPPGAGRSWSCARGTTGREGIRRPPRPPSAGGSDEARAMSSFPGSPRILKGAIVAYALPALIPKVVVFQYNPEQVTRSLSPRTAEGGGAARGEALRTDGPPEETISLSVEIDAADQLERP